MLKKTMIIVAGLALGATALQTEAFARGGGGGGGGGHGGGGGGGHGGGFGHHGDRAGPDFFGDDAFDYGDWPYENNCYRTRWHRYVCH